MDVVEIFDLWTTGTFDETMTLNLDPGRTYMLGTFMVKTDGSYAHTYISEVCTADSDQVRCGIRDEASAPSVEFISNAVSATVALTSKGGDHRAEGFLFVL